jgi:hypothetical protein
MVLVLSHPIHIARKKNVVSEGNLSRANRETSGVNIRVLFAGVFVQQLRS